MTARHRGPLTAEQQALASDPRYLRMALGLARVQGHRYPVLADEFESAAMVALVDAAATFDPERGRLFRNHARRRIAGAMVDCQRDWMPLWFRRHNRDRMPRVTSIARIRRFADEGPVGWEIEALDELKRLTRHLPVKHRTILRLLYGHAETSRMRVAGMATGLSESWVSKVHTEAIQMLRG